MSTSAIELLRLQAANLRGEASLLDAIIKSDIPKHKNGTISDLESVSLSLRNAASELEYLATRIASFY